MIDRSILEELISIAFKSLSILYVLILINLSSMNSFFYSFKTLFSVNMLFLLFSQKVAEMQQKFRFSASCKLAVKNWRVKFDFQLNNLLHILFAPFTVCILF